MADLSDVIDATTALLWSAFYPGGQGTTSVLGTMAVKVKPGWPLAGDLDKEVGGVKDVISLMDRGVYVSVFAPPNLERSTTRALPTWLEVGPPTYPLALAVSGQSVTITGAPAVPQNLALIVNDTAVLATVQAADTLASLAQRLASAAQARGLAATASGNVVTFPGTGAITARVGSVRTLAKEVERTQRQIMTTIWAPTPTLRSAAGKVVRARLADTADLPGCHNRFLPLCDGSAAWIVYDHTNDWDQDQRAGLYRRDICHWFEFGQYVTTEASEVILAEVSTTPSIPLAPTVTTFL
ncbi:hypothetical protein ACLBYG_22380 [Methylobacterium sp. D53M]